MPTFVIINSIVCVMGVVIGILFTGASIISIANMTVPWRGFLIVAALLVPVMFLVSGVGTWLAYGQVSISVVRWLIALPWMYGVLFVLVMVGSFQV